MDLIKAVTTSITTVLDWIGVVIKSLVTAGNGSDVAAGALHELLPLFAIGISISAILLGVKIIKSFVWGS